MALLEAGGRNDNWVVTTPGALILMISGKVNNWAFNTVPQPGLNGRRGYQPRGKGLGGSSAINAMVYMRGHRRDYDHWAALGNAGWSYDDVLPYFKRAENNEPSSTASITARRAAQRVEAAQPDNPMQEIYPAGRRANCSWPITDDFNGAAAGRPRRLPGDAEERRALERGARLHPSHWASGPTCGSRPGAQATRILFEGKRAVGVEYRQGNEHEADARTARGDPRRRARSSRRSC